MTPTHSPDRPFDFVPLLTTCCVITFGCYFATAMRLPVMPLYARTIGVTTVQIGIINSAFYLMAGLFSFPSGFLAVKFGSRRLTVYGLAVLATASFLLFFSRSFSELTVLYLMLGLGVAAFGPTMMTLVAEIAPATHLGRAYGWYTTALFSGLSLGPGVGGALGQWIGLRPVFIVTSICILFNMWAVVVFMPDRRPGRQNTPRNQTRSNQSGPFQSDQNQATPNKTGREQFGWFDNLRVLLRNQALMGCWLITFGANMVGGMFFTFLPLHALEQQLSVAQTGIVFLVQALTNAASRILFGTLSDRVSQRKYLVIGGIVLVGLSISGFGWAASFYQFVIAGIGLGLGMGLAFTSIGALIAEAVDKRLRGPAMGGYNACIYFGMMIGSMVYGPVIDTIGFDRGFSLNGCIIIIFGLSFLGLMRGFQPLWQGK